MITADSALTFGRHKGTQLQYCPLSYLKWLSETLIDTDFHEWAIVAWKLHADLMIESTDNHNLELQADAFLRSKGVRVGKGGQIL